MAIKHTLNIVRGKTTQLVIRWETTPVVSKAITANYSMGWMNENGELQ